MPPLLCLQYLSRSGLKTIQSQFITSSKIFNYYLREKRFLADAAHELRTPLTVIKLQVEQALIQPDAREMILQRLSDSVDRNQQVVEQMLLLARLEAGQMTVHSSKVIF